MGRERFFVTGATGCIGSWIVRNLLKEGFPVRATVRDSSTHRLRMIMTDRELEKVDFVKCDITDRNLLKDAVSDFGTTHIIHLAALQLPFCSENPPLGARVNVEGTVNVFEAAVSSGVDRVVFASSAAVYGLKEEYEDGRITDESPLNPRSHYGVYKVANEGISRVYSIERGLASIGLRPHVVYGPGRDQGLTSAPTKAIYAAVCGEDFHAAFGGSFTLQYTEDTANAFIKAAMVAFEGSRVFNIGGPPVSMSEVISIIEEIFPSMKGRITYEDKSLPFPEEMDNKALVELIGNPIQTTLQNGVEKTARILRDAVERRIIK